MSSDLLTVAHRALEEYRRNGSGLTTRVVLFTPDVAAEWIEATAYARQRPLRKANVQRYAEAMKAGTFKPGAIEVRRVADKRYLIDGQHRLHALVLSGASLPLVVIEKAADSLEEVAADYARTDMFGRRTLSQAYAAYGLHDETALSDRHIRQLGAAVALIARRFVDINLTDLDERIRLLRAWSAEARVYFEATSGVREVISDRLMAAGCVAPGVITFRHQPERAAEFWSGVASGTNLSKGDPRHTLMWHLLNETWRQRRHLNAAQQSRVTARCWNAFFEGRELVMVKMIDTNSQFSLSGTDFE